MSGIDPANPVIRFGPAGAADDFYAEKKGRSSTEMPAWLRGLGLDAFEYQCGRGVNISLEKAAALGAAARENGVALSLHAPYYISLTSLEQDKRENNINYILQSAQAAAAMGACRVVVHTGSAGGAAGGSAARKNALAAAADMLALALAALEANGLGHVRLCPETMGKINQLGTLEEVLRLAAGDERLIPCVDFGHLNARTHGGLKTEDDFAALLDVMENAIGRERASAMHCHFSKIEYSAGGELRHLTFEDAAFGPDFAPLAKVIKRRGYHPVFICESRGTQSRDAVSMRRVYDEA